MTVRLLLGTLVCLTVLAGCKSDDSVSEVPTARSALNQWQMHVVDSATPWQAIFIDHGDIDGDGLTDIVAGGWWYKNPGILGATWDRIDLGGNLSNMAYVRDMDGDGHIDVLATNGRFRGNQFYWGENDGSGAFTEISIGTTGVAANAFLQGVAGSPPSDDGGPLEIFLSWQGGERGNSNVQSWTVPANPANEPWVWNEVHPSSCGEGLSAGDIDGDGDFDIAQGLQWLRNDGDGKWTMFPQAKVGLENGEPDRNRLGDLDGDGDLDVVVGFSHFKGEAADLIWLENPDANPTRDWPVHVISSDAWGGYSVQLADFDRDEDLDVVLGEHRGKTRMFVYENDGAGQSWIRHAIDPGVPGVDHHDGPSVVDIDGDGDLDILSLGWDNDKVLIFENRTYFDGGLNFEHVAIDKESGGRSAIGDVDGDGFNDIVLHTWASARGRGNDGRISWYRFPDWRRYSIVNNANIFGDSIIATDLDGDGDNDLVTSTGNDNEASLVWYENLGGGTASGWKEHELATVEGKSKIKNIAVHDMDRDGKHDVVVRTTHKFVVYFQEARDSWAEYKTDNPEREGMAIGDLDGDGDYDVVMNGFWLENPKHPRSDTWDRHDIDPMWYSDDTNGWQDHSVMSDVKDLNNDGHVDVILSQSEKTGFPVVWYESENPQGGPSAWKKHQIGTVDFCHTLCGADMDLDGDVDIVAANLIRQKNPEILIFVNNGKGLSWNEHLLAGASAYKAITGDIDNDGDIDVVTARSWDTGPLQLWRNEAAPGVPPR